MEERFHHPLPVMRPCVHLFRQIAADVLNTTVAVYIIFSGASWVVDPRHKSIVGPITNFVRHISSSSWYTT